ncbi:ParB/RepB/Spo0J family partition protein [Cuneatibacter caecimuris]|uniref:ParB family chromosome partitioning protein n=1 Tax=Cuneatibacter caecimuris TaxID=1796618 RepID=A0A4Q7P352_9FIRM|nr:ParB/RepB/Spo0J family partition protein [Cuneatibacter caecimuris]RZS94346.1 ParB family chromosome partitioning protein [Cuneatibacter caecimuris]
MKKGGLGRGLDSLIPNTNIEKKNDLQKSQITKREKEDQKSEMMLRLSKIEPNRRQPRKQFDEDTLVELAESIKLYGVIQPLIVQLKGDHYEIIAGERRWRAAKLAGLKEVPVMVREYTDKEVAEISLVENLQRDDLNPIEEAMAYQRLLKEFNLKQDEVAERVSKSRTAITNSMRLLKLDEKVQEFIAEGLISTGHGKVLLAVEDKELQREIARQIIDEKLSVRETEAVVRLCLNPRPVKEEIELPHQEIYVDFEEKMKQRMGTKVKIKRKEENKGKIEIDYYSLEDFERLMQLFGI